MKNAMHTQRRWADDTCHIIINESISLNGNLRLLPHPKGVIIFAHGSGSSRFSPRNQFVARVLQRAGFATLLLDLLTAQEETLDQAHAHLRFNIPLLSSRVQATTRWLLTQSTCAGLSIGYFGASTGAAAALVAAARQPELVAAVVSRGGRPDLANAELEHVQAPTLLIVGALDEQVIDLNKEALARLHVEKHLELVPNATHLFEEPGTLEQVADLAQQWFARYLPPARGEVHEQHLS